MKLKDQARLSFCVSVACSVAAAALLEFREMAGVTLVLLSVLLWERSRVLHWRRCEEDRKTAANEERMAADQDRLKERRPR